MNIIIITEKDAANASVSKVANRLAANGNSVRVFFPFYFEALIREYSKSIFIYPIEELNDDSLDWCDMVFLASIAVDYVNEALLRIRKPIFTHSYLINAQIDWGGDCRFVSSLETASMDYQDMMDQINIAVGEPKYDSGQCNIVKQQKKRFLFIDSGHFPFARKGKYELAKCVLSICENNPEYELVVKPRFLPSDKIITHRNLYTLFDALTDASHGKFPDNLVYLDKHYDLMTLIEQSDVIICLYTSAFVGACAANKGLIILEGFDSEDVYDVRTTNFLKLREKMVCTNALIPYKDVNKFLPKGIHIDSNSQKELLAEKDAAADKICEVIEYLYQRYYKRGIFPYVNNYDYKNYTDMIQDQKCDWNVVINRRIKNYLIRQTLIHFSFRVSVLLDVSIIREYINTIDCQAVSLRDELTYCKILRSRCLVDNSTILMQDEIDSGILLNALYTLGLYDAILNFERKDIGAYFLYSAFVWMEKGETQFAIKGFERYFEVTKNRAYIKEISDMSDNRFRAYRSLIDLYRIFEEHDKARECLMQMEAFYKTNFLVSNIEQGDINDKKQKELLEYIKTQKIQLNST
jgi:hypothetical protein